MDFDFQFYPTPEMLAKKCWKKFKNREFVRVLEPSAGDGALAKGYPDYSHRYGHRIQIDCCELDLSKHVVLREAGFQVIGMDFMQMKSASQYSHCLMNPPFAVGVQHLLWAYKLLWDAEIVCILNAESIKNPFSKERQMVVQLIEQCGSVEFVEDAFMDPDTKRKTPVEIAVVHLIKTANFDSDIVGEILSELRVDNIDHEQSGYKEEQAITLPNSYIESTVAAFNAAVKSMKDSVFSQARANYYERLLGETMAVRNGDGSATTKNESAIAWVQNTLSERYLTLKDRAWAGILRSSNVTDRLSLKAQQRVESEFEMIKQLEFTVSNVYGFIQGLIENQREIQIDMACDCFDAIVRYHTNNHVYYRGWVSNNAHQPCWDAYSSHPFHFARA